MVICRADSRRSYFVTVYTVLFRNRNEQELFDQIQKNSLTTLFRCSIINLYVNIYYVYVHHADIYHACVHHAKRSNLQSETTL